MGLIMATLSGFFRLGAVAVRTPAASSWLEAGVNRGSDRADPWMQPVAFSNSRRDEA